MFFSDGWVTWLLAGMYVVCIAVAAVLEYNARKKEKSDTRREAGRQ